MLTRFVLSGIIVFSFTATASAQRRDTSTFVPMPATPAAGDAEAEAPAAGGPKWRNAKAAPRASLAPTDEQTPAQPAANAGPRTSIARVSDEPNTLSSDAGQVWRHYDISPYTARVSSTNRPEQAILDWLLRETGYEVWHTQPMAVLSIDGRRLSVYHTPEVQAVVSEMVDRFVNTEAESHAFNMRVITVGSPDWRAKDHRMLHPVAAQSQGVQAWLLHKEDAALLAANLRRRSDFQEHSTPHLLVINGQSKLISAMRPRNYVRDVLLNSNPWPGYEPQLAQYDEGFKLEFSPLLSLDGRVVDAVLRCEVDQIEKMIPVNIPVPTSVAPRQQQKIEVPQPISTRLHERFRWPVDQVLLISLGVGPAPVSTPANPLSLKTIPLVSGPARADLLIFVESKGKASAQPTALPAGAPAASAYRNRY